MISKANNILNNIYKENNRIINKLFKELLKEWAEPPFKKSYCKNSKESNLSYLLV